MRAPLLALQAALLGPALLLGPDPVLWGTLLLLLPLNALALAYPGCRVRWSEPCGAWWLLGLLVLAPLEAVLLRAGCRLTGLDPDLPVLVLCLLLLTHGPALLLLLAREPGERAARRALGIQAAFWLPLPLAGLFLVGRLEALADLALRAAGGGSPGGGWLRLPLAALLLALLQQREQRRRAQDGPAGPGGAA